MLSQLIAIVVVGLLTVAGGVMAWLVVSARRAELSIPAQLIRRLLPMMGIKTTTHAELMASIQKDRAKGLSLPTPAFCEKFDVKQTHVHNHLLVTVAPRETTNKDLRILFLHGGSYVFDVQTLHWDVVEQWVERTGATLLLPVYPLAPEHDWQPAHKMAMTVYDQLCQEVGAENIVIAGDSAGGGFALSLAQQIRDLAQPLPAALVLFSPWLDVTLSDSAQPDIEKRDPILSIATLRMSGELWAGDLPTNDPRISPLFGSMQELPPIAIFAGTDDLLFPDASRLAATLEEVGGTFAFYELRNGIHDWVVIAPQFVSEAKRTLDQAAAFIGKHRK
jgi:acetyl esterase/lipase